MESDELKDRWQVYVQPLAREIMRGEASLGGVAYRLKEVLDRGAWRAFHNGREPLEYNHFEEFITAKGTDGLATDVDTLRALIRDDDDAKRMLDQALQRPHGGDRKSEAFTEAEIKLDNIQLDPPPTGTSPEAALRRLRKEGRTDLLERISAGELTPHAAAVEAGFRKKTITVPVDVSLARGPLEKAFSLDELRELSAPWQADSE